MDVSISDHILAVVTTESHRNQVMGSVTVFITDNDDKAQRLCLLLSRTLKAMSHDLENGMYIIVKH